MEEIRMVRRTAAYKLTRRGVFLVALAGLAEIVYHKENDVRRGAQHYRMDTFTPISIRPSQILDLKSWKINLPTGNKQVSQPDLSHFSSSAFKVSAAVQFTAMCGGQAQPGSDYPRSELREMNADGSNASWSPAVGTHVMELTERITHLPVAKPQLVCAQIHNDSTYLILVELDRHTLYVRYKDSVAGVLDSNYQLGTFFDLRIEASQGYATVFYNGVRKVRQALDAPGCYFKAGCYVQSNTSTGDLPTAFGQVEISRLELSHA
jgi:poly(beta-D-mannuronate) lyase